MHVIDTGMGFERLVRAMQGKNSNYDTDIFQPILHKIGELSGHEYGKSEEVDVAMRVVADHLRAIAFSIADGQLPSNAKAGYVIRRILRRAVRYAYISSASAMPSSICSCRHWYTKWAKPILNSKRSRNSSHA